MIDRDSKKKIEKEKDHFVIYTDGSYDNFNKEASYSLIVSDFHSIFEESGSVEDQFSLGSMLGELIAIIQSIKYLKNHNKKGIIYTDCLQSIKLLNKNPNKEFLKDYIKFMNINESYYYLKKINGHNRRYIYNHLADTEARKVLDKYERFI